MTDEEALTQLGRAVDVIESEFGDTSHPERDALAHVRQRLGLLKEVPLWAESIDLGRGASVTGTPREMRFVEGPPVVLSDAERRMILKQMLLDELWTFRPETIALLREVHQETRQ